MPVDTQHPEYKANIKKWKKYRIVISGEDAVKEAGTSLLPMLGGQEKEEIIIGGGDGSYEAYKERASFFAAAARTVDGIEGAVFRKDPTIEFPESRLSFLDAIGKEGTPFYTFAKKVFNNTLVIGRHGCLLDTGDNAGATDDPYLVSYNAESIINWRTTMVNGREQLSMVVLMEKTYIPDPEDNFSLIEKKIIRVLNLTAVQDGDAVSYVYTVDEWKENTSKSAREDTFILFNTFAPTIRGDTLEYIPFVFFGPKELTTDVQKSPMADIVAINISHYRSSADIEHGRHFTALPTAWAAGFEVGTELPIGSTIAWIAENPAANASFLEFTGQGLGAIETAQERKELQMTILGARMLEEPKKAVEAADTHLLRKGGEEGVTSALARTTSAGFTQLLTWAASWMGVADTENISCVLNRDYTSAGISPQMLVALMAALQGGNLSKDTWVYNLKRGAILPEGRTVEEELALIDENPPIPPNEEMALGLDGPL